MPFREVVEGARTRRELFPGVGLSSLRGGKGEARGEGDPAGSAAFRAVPETLALIRTGLGPVVLAGLGGPASGPGLCGGSCALRPTGVRRLRDDSEGAWWSFKLSLRLRSVVSIERARTSGEAVPARL
jgi:hypothetical protein